MKSASSLEEYRQFQFTFKKSLSYYTPRLLTLFWQCLGDSLKCESLLPPNTRDSLVLLIYLSLIKEYQLKITSNMINKSKSVMVSNFVELTLKIGNVPENNYGFIVSIKLRRDQVIKKAWNQMQVYLLKYTHQLFLICQA